MWKIIPNTNNGYSANRCTGQIKSNDRFSIDGRKLKGKILKPFKNNSGYLVVDLCIYGKRKKCLVHRLIAQTFLNNYSNKLDVNHKDGNKLNNSLINLECITRKENIIHAIKNGLIIESIKQKINRKNIKFISKKLLSKPIDMYDLRGNFEEHFNSLADAYRKYKYNESAIRRCANGQQKTSYNHIWKWANKNEV